MYEYVYIGFKTFFYVVRHLDSIASYLPTGLHLGSSHWPSFRFLSFMAFFIPSIQFFFGLPRALFGFGIHFNAILGRGRKTRYRHYSVPANPHPKPVPIQTNLPTYRP